MTHNNVFVAILALLSAFSAFGSEKQPSRMARIDKTFRYGCVGAYGGPALYALTKGCASDIRFSQEDLFPMAISSAIGFVVTASVLEMRDWYGQRQISRQFKPIKTKPQQEFKLDMSGYYTLKSSDEINSLIRKPETE